MDKNNQSEEITKSDDGQDQYIRKIIESRLSIREDQLKSFISEKAFNFLDNNLKYLLMSSILLDEVFTTYSNDTPTGDLKSIDMILFSKDYSFIALPAAKAFEGYLRELLIKLRLLKKSDLKKDPFQGLGRIINSDKFENKIRDKRYRFAPKKIQMEWDMSRNFLLHYDNDKPKNYSQQETRKRIDAILETIKAGCDAFLCE